MYTVVAVILLSILVIGCLVALWMILRYKGPIELDLDLKRGGLKVKKEK
ncbi:hypothetical protein [Roseivirga thermotolerans]|jgi:hypothetical protein|nr:hypothetical protein [Roseivirga thermotolerans]|tara:strand:+ start:59897 stop:60043 length:147 start_codon:yes stop_codon:yes gene_type:complete